MLVPVQWRVGRIAEGVSSHQQTCPQEERTLPPGFRDGAHGINRALVDLGICVEWVEEELAANAKKPVRREGDWRASMQASGVRRQGRIIGRRPTLPHTYACSTIGAEGLNYRVRDGNGWDPLARVTQTWLLAGSIKDRCWQAELVSGKVIFGRMTVGEELASVLQLDCVPHLLRAERRMRS